MQHRAQFYEHCRRYAVFSDPKAVGLPVLLTGAVEAGSDDPAAAALAFQYQTVAFQKCLRVFSVALRAYQTG